MIEFTYPSEDGHVWVIRCEYTQLHAAADAAFQWFATIDEFSSQHLGAILAAIFAVAIDDGRVEPEAFDAVKKTLGLIPQSELPYADKVNLMRRIVRLALHSTT